MDDHIKSKDSYVFGLNGRVYVKDGTLAFTSIKGSTQIYNNVHIAKYLGVCVFKEQVVIFVKCTGLDVNISGVVYQTVPVDVLLAKNFAVDLSNNEFDFTTEITDNSIKTTYNESIASPAPPTEIDFQDNYAPSNSVDEDIDFSSYYQLNTNILNFSTCPNNELTIPPNNAIYSDCIITIQYNEEGVLFDRIIWNGYQNWPINGKIIALGVEENSNYKRVKYTDNVNPFRSINIFDSKLFQRGAKELNNFQSTILLQPRILTVNTNGSIKSGAVQYYYRLITENGQVTEFSPPSEMVYIYPFNNGNFIGGKPQEPTNKSVKFRINVVDPINFNEIEVVAVEYEGNGLPNNIRTLGIQTVKSVNDFFHFGSEPYFGEDTTLQELIQTNNDWKYCSDLNTKNNKLFAAGLRNDPLSSSFNELKYNFALHGWDANGGTHSTFINPNPRTYFQIPTTLTTPLFYVKKRLYNAIKVFQNSVVRFSNISTSNQFVTSVTSEDNFYVNHLEALAVWLLDQQDTNANFEAYFPNLAVEFVNNILLLKPIDPLIKTDFSIYKFTFSVNQVIDDFKDEVVFNDEPLTNQNYVDGAMSAGFNSGNGIRVTFKLVEEELATQATTVFAGAGKIIDFKNPNFKKTFFKDEIYRLAINFYKDGQRLFAIPVGDLKIPSLGDFYSYLNDDGNAVRTNDRYINQKVVGNKLMGVRVELKIEVRLDCNFSKDIDMYQILHVERTEENRTVLAQGISAPLLRVQNPPEFLEPSSYILDERLRSKWMLPYFGGPTYDKQGLDKYDSEGGEYSLPNYDWTNRTIHDRSLFYFDSPDLIYGAISNNLVNSSNVEIVGRLNTDETKSVMMESGELVTTNNGVFQNNMGSLYGTEMYPKFSRKILASQMNIPDEIANRFPAHTGDEDNINRTIQSNFVNVSVFSEFTHFTAKSTILGAVSLNPGQVIPGSDLNTSFDISNNAMCLPSMPWWYSNEVRNIKKADDQHQFEAMLASTVSIGQRTMYIRSALNLFTNSFIGPQNIPTPNPQIASPTSGINIYDSHALINIKKTNEDSVFGGRSEIAYSKNVYIPLSETIPVNKTNNASQSFNIQGDAYVSLFIRTKNSKGNSEEIRFDRNINNGRRNVSGGNAAQENDLNEVYRMEGAWMYGVVLETMIEPKLNFEYEAYRETSAINFYLPKIETLNGAYLKINNARSYIPQPFRFKDDPLLTNIVAASEVKLNGDYYDSWSIFPVNEFQELDKTRGACFNLVKMKNELFAIQERQTSLLNIDRDTMISSDSGGINVKQGAGKSIDGYSVISKYGTSVRRSIVISDTYGFSFIDETLNVLIKYDTPITIQNQYHHDFFNSLRDNPIIDVEAFFDEQHQESNFQVKQLSGLTRVLSYNEVLKGFNGFYEYNAPLYIEFQDKLFAPIENDFTINGINLKNSNSLHQLNSGLALNILGANKKMIISFICSPQIDLISLFSHISAVVGNGTTVEKIELQTKAGLERTILSTHPRFKNREGILSVPLLNYWAEDIDPSELKDLRSEFLKVTITFPYTGTEQKIVSSNLFIRQSFI